MKFGASKEQAGGTRIGIKKGGKTWCLTVTMEAVIPEDPHPGGDALC
ncbi:MAG: hypothetical protein HXY51_14620 [Nitrospirae bacterium]|nr:hypothetical protein [Nitrospirota bacterium]